jgi:hypothetical protein
MPNVYAISEKSAHDGFSAFCHTSRGTSGGAAFPFATVQFLQPAEDGQSAGPYTVRFLYLRAGTFTDSASLCHSIKCAAVTTTRVFSPRISSQRLQRAKLLGRRRVSFVRDCAESFSRNYFRFSLSAG